LIPTGIYFIYNILTKNSFFIDIRYLIIIIISAVFFNYLGNILSLKSIDLSKNSGYSLIITKSIATIFVTIISPILFSSSLNFKSLFAIILIIIFVFFISVTDIKVKEKKSFLYAILSAFFLGFHTIIVVFLQKEGLSPSIIVFYVMLIISITSLIKLYINKIKLEPSKKNIILMMNIGVSSAVFNLLFIIGFKISPNPGYINAASVSAIGLLTITNYFIFKDNLSIKRFICALGIISSLIILFI